MVDRPAGEGPRVRDGADGRIIAFQVRDWWEDGRGYRLHQFLLRERGGGWRTDHAASDDRALPRGAGLVDAMRHGPAGGGCCQPIVTARKP